MHKPWENSSGCKDLTAYAATKVLEAEEERKTDLVKVLKMIIRLSGFELVNRFELKGASGRVYK